MVLVAMMHDRAYSEKEFILPNQPPNKTSPQLLRVLGSAISIKDTARDIYDTFFAKDEHEKTK